MLGLLKQIISRLTIFKDHRDSRVEPALRVKLVSPDYQGKSAQPGELVLRELQEVLELQVFRLMALQDLQAHLVAQVLRGPLGLPVQSGP